MSERVWPIVILGAGPAGIAAAVEAARVGAQALLLDATGHAGGTIRIAHEVRNVPFVHDRATGADIAAQLAAFLGRWGLEPVQALVRSVTEEGEHLLLDAGPRRWLARAVLVATGTRALHPEVGGLGDGFVHPWYASAQQACEHRIARRSVVIGGSDVALDQARWLRARGSEVIVLHRGETTRAPRWLLEAARNEGVAVRMPARVLRGDRTEGGALLQVQDGEHITRLETDVLVAAIGRAPALPAGVQKLLVEGDQRIGVAGDAKGHRARHVVAALGDGCVVATRLLGQGKGEIG